MAASPLFSGASLLNPTRSLGGTTISNDIQVFAGLLCAMSHSRWDAPHDDTSSVRPEHCV